MRARRRRQSAAGWSDAYFQQLESGLRALFSWPRLIATADLVAVHCIIPSRVRIVRTSASVHTYQPLLQLSAAHNPNARVARQRAARTQA
eukprot:scaffold1619_cov121-Isochrysis_galbana.AAC.11